LVRKARRLLPQARFRTGFLKAMTCLGRAELIA